MDDIEHMNRALDLAREGLGRVAPNPAVGCVIVDADGVVVGKGRTADGGRPHAETIALSMAGEKAHGGTAYISLEPCAHFGKTPPCAQALIDSGIKRAVIACRDPDPRVAGQGIEMLKTAGIEVVEGVCEAEAQTLNAGFFLKVTKNRPFVTLKIALSADNKITAKAGTRTQITGTDAQEYTYGLRAQHDAILVGVNTVIADDPLLTARIDGMSHVMTRVVLDSNLRISLNSQLIQTVDAHPLFILHNPNLRGEGFSKLKDIKGVELIAIDTDDIKSVLETLANRGITRLMVEGGANIMQSFIKAGYGDEIHIIRALHEIGEGGLTLDLKGAPENLKLELSETRILGKDTLEIYR